MNIFAWLGQKIGLKTHGFWSAYYGGETWAGEPISAETAMQSVTFWRCVQIRARSLAIMPMMIYETLDDGSRKVRADHPLYRLVHDQPNADHTAFEFWEGVLGCLCLAGNAFAEKSYQGIGAARRLIAMTLLNPAYMTVIRDGSGSLRYRYIDPNGNAREYAEDEIFHVRGFGIGGDLGLSPIHYGRQSLSSSRATDRAAAATFANGMRPSGWLVYKGGILKPEQRDQAKKVLIEPMQGAENAGKTGILEGDFDYRQMSIPPETAQLLESRAFSVEETCRLVGVPPVMAGHSSQGQTMFGAGVFQVIQGFYTTTVLPDMVCIQQAANKSLISPEERGRVYCEFLPDRLLQIDPASRWEAYWKAVQVGAMTPNQICDKENLPRFDGGDVHLVNQTLAPLAQAGTSIRETLQDRSVTPVPLSPPAAAVPPKLEVVR